MAEFPTSPRRADRRDLNRSVPGTKPSSYQAHPRRRHGPVPPRLAVGKHWSACHQFPDPAATNHSHERASGLDHLAFACANRSSLLNGNTSNKLGITTAGSSTRRTDRDVIRDPDNIAARVIRTTRLISITRTRRGQRVPGKHRPNVPPEDAPYAGTGGFATVADRLGQMFAGSW